MSKRCKVAELKVTFGRAATERRQYNHISYLSLARYARPLFGILTIFLMATRLSVTQSLPSMTPDATMRPFLRQR